MLDRARERASAEEGRPRVRWYVAPADHTLHAHYKDMSFREEVALFSQAAVAVGMSAVRALARRVPHGYLNVFYLHSAL